MRQLDGPQENFGNFSYRRDSPSLAKLVSLLKLLVPLLSKL